MELWFHIRASALSYHCWDDDAVVFNQVNGETHHVSSLAIELLKSLQSARGLTSENLLLELADVFTDFGPDESRQMIEDGLSQLEARSLVKRVLI